MDEIKVYVASSSKSRRELAKEYNLDWIFVDNEFDEEKVKENIKIANFESAMNYTKILAKGKAESVISKYQGIIIGCDSIVYQNGIILEKPKNVKEFNKMMDLITDKHHYLITGIAMIDTRTNKIIQFAEITKLKFDKFNEEQKQSLLNRHNGLSNAGGYTLCDEIAENTHIIKGDRNNVIGLPIKRILFELKNIK